MLQNAVQMVEAYMPRKPDPKLAETDPFAYQSQRANYEAALEKLEATRQNERNFVSRRASNSTIAISSISPIRPMPPCKSSPS